MSSAYTTTAELFLEGRVAAARREALTLRATHIQPTCVGDYLLCADISRASRRYGEYHATIRLAARRFPNDPDLLYSMSRASYAIGRWRQSLASLDRIDSKAHAPLVSAARASVYSAIGRRAEYERYRAEVADVTASDPFICYELAHAARVARDHSGAAELARQSVQFAPKWMRARIQWCSALLNAGRSAEARAAIEQGVGLGLEDLDFAMFRAEVDFARLDFKGAARTLLEARKAWSPLRDSQLEFLLAHALWSCGHHEQAKSIATDTPFSEFFVDAEPGEAAHLAAPFIAQQPDQCVPTSATIVAASQGLRLDPLALYEAMRGCGGTQMWRMAEVFQNDFGCRVEYVQATPEAVMTYVERGIALIGERVGLLSSHVEVICGFDAGLQLFQIRDPEAWMPRFFEIDQIASRYASSGSYLHAIIADGGFVPDPRHSSKRGAAMVRLERAISLGESSIAEEAVAALRGDPQWEVLADLTGVGVTKSPARTRRDLMRALTITELHPVVAMRAHMVVLADDTADAVIASAERHVGVIGEGGLRFIRMLCDFARGRWAQALEHVDAFLERSPEADSFWCYRSQILANMGRVEEAREAADIAVDISPDSFSNRSLRREMYMSTATFSKLRSEIEAARQSYPDVVSLRIKYAEILAQYGTDGLEAERALVEATEFLPRDPESWRQLAQWYSDQERDDKVDATLELARRWLDETDAPWLTERGDGDAAPGSEDDGARTRGSEAPRSELPEPTRASQRPPGATSVPPAFASRWSVLETARPAIFGDPEATARARRAAQRLNELDRQGQLAWDEAALLRAWQVECCSGSDREGERATAILELPVNGPVTLFVQRLIGTLSLEHCSDVVLRAVAAWATKSVPVEDGTASLRYVLAELYAMIGELSLSEAALNEIRRVHPNHDGTLFRIAQLAAHRGQDIAAANGYRAVLDVSPGHVGALRGLVSAYSSMGELDKAALVQERMVLRYPYHLQELDRLLRLVSATRSPDDALEVLRAQTEFHSEDWIRALGASLHMTAGRNGRAREILDRIPITQDSPQSLQMYVMQQRLEQAWSGGTMEEYGALTARAVREFPFDLEFQRLRAAFLTHTDPERAKKVLDSAFQQGYVDAKLMQLDAEVFDFDLERAKRVVAEVVPESAVFEALGAAIEVYRARMDRYPELLRWSADAFPQVLRIRQMWIEALFDSGRDHEAIEACEQFEVDYPEEKLALLQLRGHCYSRKDPDRAIEALQQILEIRGDAALYNQLAEAHCNKGDKASARAVLEQLLERSRCQGHALTQLYWLGDSPSKLADGVFHCIENSNDAPAYLHVLAVECARETQRTVPLRWYSGALARLGIAQSSPAVRDEIPRLRKCLNEWQKQHPDPHADRVKGSAAVVKLWGWPGRAWIPAA